ncbi:hypothetical protein ACFQ1E_12245 [Sphingomonas canadensis]|uniref:Uncharacterized protein n=1 Tax=Sphingomonas canadensis TaxID=1219257 RepID=A0ABW3H6I9_9SPHN|nr:hypothetical protein [Sphingomonas canadensis]MCW3836755.1 hypothetical protein [Sphingomonas canadensis]
MSDPEDSKPKPVASDALARARAALDGIGTPTAREEIAATDPHDAPLADPELGPEPAYHKEPETAPADAPPPRSAADVARAMQDAPPELAVFAPTPPPPPAPPERAEPVAPAAREPESAPAPAPVRERLGDTTSPVDLPEPAVPLPHPLRWTTIVIAVATLFLALFNAQTIRSWAYQLPPSPLSASIAGAAETWFNITASVGLDRPYAALHAWYGDLKDARFGEDAKAGEGGPENAAAAAE